MNPNQIKLFIGLITIIILMGLFYCTTANGLEALPPLGDLPSTEQWLDNNGGKKEIVPTKPIPISLPEIVKTETITDREEVTGVEDVLPDPIFKDGVEVVQGVKHTKITSHSGSFMGIVFIFVLIGIVVIFGLIAICI
jgi:hypothetical protein